MTFDLRSTLLGAAKALGWVQSQQTWQVCVCGRGIYKEEEEEEEEGEKEERKSE